MMFSIRFFIISISVLYSEVISTTLDNIWIYTPNSGSTDSRYIPDVYKLYTNLFQYKAFKNQELFFRVKACRDAFILLSSAPDLISSDLYEPFFEGGGNQYWGALRTGVSVYLSDPYQYVLNCNEYRMFRCSWSVNGRILLERITETSNVTLMDWTDPSPLQIKGVGIRAAYGADATWEILRAGTHDGYYCGADKTFANMPILRTYPMQSRILCAILCSSESQCLGFNFNKITSECQLIAAKQLMVKQALADWMFYVKC